VGLESRFAVGGGTVPVLWRGVGPLRRCFIGIELKFVAVVARRRFLCYCGMV